MESERKAARVAAAGRFVAQCMDEIMTRFKPGAKITVLVRKPDDPDADFCMTSDDLSEVAAMVARRQEAEHAR